MYHAIGKAEWEKLPSIFMNVDLAKQLDKNETWWCWTNTFPHAYRVKYDPSLGEEVPLMCTMNQGISFNKSTGYFTKFMQNVGYE